MRRLFAATVAVLLAASLTGCSTAEKKSEARLPAVTLAPLRTSDQPVTLGDLKGPLVVNLWANWCKPCRRELPIYQQFHAQHPGVKVLGIDWMDPARNQALSLADRTGLTYPLVVDPDRKIPGQALPKLILLDAKGRIAFQEYVEIKSLAQLDALVRKHLGATL